MVNPGFKVHQPQLTIRIGFRGEAWGIVLPCTSIVLQEKKTSSMELKNELRLMRA